ncbi:hypothetical protein GLOIN_2v1828103 [Rhizophagus clarus]|uniref:Uncharacterized protein n=1 Tax=Rhizophagus clarus TaxID=94130 RepID=A0A8H3L0X5_9GLOM|nr:hypothetical protein GLOIN_2v1828103 [Rhizophagus clarus]
MVSNERSASGTKTNQKKSQYSGIHVFRFDIEVLHQVQIEQFRKPSTGKVIIDKRKRPLNEVQSHQMILESGNPICIYNMELGYENQIINIKYNSIIDNARLDTYVRACDEALLGCDEYRRFAAVEARLIQLNQQPILDDDDESQDNPDGIVVDEQKIGNGKENYETLAKVRHLFEYQLWDLQENGIYDDNGNMDLQWPINENTKCKKKPVLFPAIKQENYIPDELHLMLRISDSKSHGGKWDWTSLMGPDKKKVLQYFPVSDFILERRGKDIEKLWHDFYELYLVLRKPILTNSEIDDFKLRKEDITPYMHVFSKHIPEFLQNLKEKNLSLWLFSTSSIEKKNHNQVRLFFGGTTMGGGIKGKSVVHDIMEFENRQLYYLINNTPQEIQMRNINAEDKENKDP